MSLLSIFMMETTFCQFLGTKKSSNISSTLRAIFLGFRDFVFSAVTSERIQATLLPSQLSRKLIFDMKRHDMNKRIECDSNLMNVSIC
jgi:hypothetical protein